MASTAPPTTTGTPTPTTIDPNVIALAFIQAMNSGGASNPRFQTLTDRASGVQYRLDADGNPVPLTRPMQIEGPEGWETVQVPIYGDQDQPGLSFEQQYALRTAPSHSTSSSSSYNVSQSIADPRQIEIAMRQLEQDAQNAANRHLIDLENLDITRDKMRLEEERGNKQIALQERGLFEQIRARIDNRELAMQQMRQSAEQFREQLGFQRDQLEVQKYEGRMNRALSVLGMAESARQANADRRVKIVEQIAAAFQRPGDVVRAAGLQQQYQQRGSGSGISTAIGAGESAITDESLMPLEELIGQREEADAREQTLLGQAMAARKALESPFPAMRGPGFEMGQLKAGATNPYQVEGSPEVDPYTGRKPGEPDPSLDTAAAGIDPRFEYAQMAEHGGVFKNRVITGDSSDGKENPEMVTVLKDGSILVEPIDGKLPDGVPKAEEGGVFGKGIVEPLRQPSIVPTPPSASTGAAGGGLTSATSRAQSMLSEALQRALGRVSGAGLDPNQMMTPVGVSAPGTSPVLQAIAASLASARSGIDPSLFNAETQAVAPVAHPGVFTRRTR